MEALGFKHSPVTAYWPQANGIVQRFNQPLRKAIQTAFSEGRIRRQELNRFLLQYRSTPHSVTRVAHCERFFYRSNHGKLPSISKKLIIHKHKKARDNE